MSLLEKLQVLSIFLFVKSICFISPVEVLLSGEINIRVSLQGFPTPITSALSMASPQSVHHFVFSGRKYSWLFSGRRHQTANCSPLRWVTAFISFYQLYLLHCYCFTLSASISPLLLNTTILFSYSTFLQSGDFRRPASPGQTRPPHIPARPEPRCPGEQLGWHGGTEAQRSPPSKLHQILAALSLETPPTQDHSSATVFSAAVHTNIYLFLLNRRA